MKCKLSFVLEFLLFIPLCVLLLLLLFLNGRLYSLLERSQPKKLRFRTFVSLTLGPLTALLLLMASYRFQSITNKSQKKIYRCLFVDFWLSGFQPIGVYSLKVKRIFFPYDIFFVSGRVTVK